MIGKTIETVIAEKVKEILTSSKQVELPEDIIETDNLGEVIEKLAILHCRMWYLEDAIAENYGNDTKVAELKRKIDICFKDKRPMYVQAINRMVEKSIADGKSLVSDSVKLYKGYQT
jgi:2-phosphoglycerate kinase